MMINFNCRKIKTMRTVFYLLVLCIVISSCKKDTSPKIPPPSSQTPAQPSGYVVGNREYFWGEGWKKTSSGYEMHLDTWRLTDSAISKGINVYVAMWTEMTVFESIPSIFYDFTRKDSVRLSYTVIPGQLQVLAKSPSELDYESDVMIEYK